MPQQWKDAIIMVLHKKKELDRVRQLQGYLAGSAHREDSAEDHCSPPQRVLRARGVPAGRTAVVFRPIRSTAVDIMFVIRRLQELARKKNIYYMYALSTLPKRAIPFTKPSSGQYSPVMACHRI